MLKRFLDSSDGTQRCPDCDELIQSDAINIKEGVALCPGCGKLSRLSELNTSGVSNSEILSHPPSGCSAVSDGNRVTAKVSLRSLPGFVITAGFALFWNGITSVFVLLALAGIYTNLIGPLPQWFPAPGLKNGRPEMNGEAMDVGATLFLCVFLIPFVTVGVAMIITSLINLIGRVEVVIDEWDSYVATGLPFLRWKKRFNAREVQSVELVAASWQSENRQNRLIEIKADRDVRFGTLLPEDKMQWLRVVLRQLLVAQNSDQRTPSLPALSWLARRS